MKKVLFFCLLALVSCSKPTNKFTVDNIVTDISFKAQHEEEHCSKGCSYETVPDIWWIRFCNVKDAKDCGSIEISHAPWKWQLEGNKVTVQWQRWSDGDISFNEMWPTEN